MARARPTRLDRELLALAVPALGALAAAPLYLLTDTAIVGHLGTRQLGALALRGDDPRDGRLAWRLPGLRDDRA